MLGSRWSSTMLSAVTHFRPSLPLVRPVAAPASVRALTTVTAPDMFCFQCEQTEGADLLIHEVKGLAQYNVAAKAKGVDTAASDELMMEALFSTLTNVNFSAEAVGDYVHRVQAAKKSLATAMGAPLDGPYAATDGAGDLAAMEAKGREVGVLSQGDPHVDDVLGLGQLLTYGVKGTAAYSAHAWATGVTNPDIPAFLSQAMAYLTKPPSEQTVPELLELCLKCGETNVTAMGLLNEGHVARFGVPEPTKVRTSGVAGKAALLVSGHDLTDLEAVLQQTEGTGVDVYTHGEMLPAHGYPGLKKYPHLKGNFGGAWQMQKLDFAMFPGAVLVTTNCIIEPMEAYKDRIFTTNAVGYDGVTHVTDKDFSAVVAKALECNGFAEDEREAYTMTGFGHQAVLGAADQVLAAVGDGRIKNFFLIGGCDGSERERSYFKKLARSAPEDSVVLTLGCAKYRFNKFDFGLIEGTDLPRMMDIGQCNDSFSAVQIATGLAGALGCGINDLPLHFAVSWFEQKAVAVLLSLLHLGVRGIHIGPELPAFVTPAVLDVLVKEWRLTPIGDAKTDLNKFLTSGGSYKAVESASA